MKCIICENKLADDEELCYICKYFIEHHHKDEKNREKTLSYFRELKKSKEEDKNV